MWNYSEIFDRNIGLLSYEQQNKLKETRIAVFGTGGIGGVIAEILTRSGIGHLVLVDRDKFDVSNMNRQIYAYTNTLGKYKVDVTEQFLKLINPDIKIDKYLHINTKTISDILKDVNIALLALDDAIPIVIISRYAREHNIPLIEGWAIPFGNVRVFTKSTPDLENIYNLELNNASLEEISSEERKAINLKMLMELKKIKGIQEYYPDLAMERINNGQITSFAPMVWLTSVLMCVEVFKILLGWGNVAYSPDFNLYNPFNHSIISNQPECE